MKKLILSIILLGSVAYAGAQGSIAEYVEKSISYYQESEQIAYSVLFNIYEDSIASTPLSTDQMHYAKSNNQECILAEGAIMICKDSLLLSVLPEEKVMFLQRNEASVNQQYIQQLKRLVNNWDNYTISEDPVKQGGEIIYTLIPKTVDEYSKIELVFDQSTKLLSRSTAWINGIFEVDGITLKSPKIEVEYTRLLKPEIKSKDIQDYLNPDLTLKDHYTAYSFYNTIQ